MLSILIPVYNFNIVSLVSELQKQATDCEIEFEIIVLDDCSSSLLRDQNKDVGNLPGVRFLELPQNIGRSKIRNRLAQMAVYPTLLFMDCDSQVASSDYIKNYIPYIGREMVVCGGNIYTDEPPEETEFMLRWLYGIKREQVRADVRNNNPYRSFMTNNFLISKYIFKQIRFDESIVQYGHEDTLFGIELKKNEILITHIQNPLYHIGLEIAREFLRKTDEAVENLLSLLYAGKISHEDINDIGLLKAYRFLSYYKLVKFYLFFYKFISGNVTRNLLGSNPSIFAFDLYKLSLISRLIRRRKEKGLPV